MLIRGFQRASRSRSILISVLVSLTLAAGFWALSPRSALDAGVAMLAAGGAVLAARLTLGHPSAAFGVLLLLASMSRPTLELPIGTMRIEQPAIGAVFVTLAATGQLRGHVWLRPIYPILAAFGIYLATLTLSSLLQAPSVLDSLRIVGWTALSMGGGLTGALLLRPMVAAAISWFTLAGLAAAIVGLALGVLFLVAGPNIEPFQSGRKVAGYAWEANLYASFLAAAAPFSLEALRRRTTISTVVAPLVILAALGLGLTRGAYGGLFVGFTVYLATVAWRRGAMRSLGAIVLVATCGLGLGAAAAAVLLPTERPLRAEAQRPTTTPTARPLSATPTPAPTPRPTPIGPRSGDETLGYRIARIPPALADLEESPLIGLGANTFGQRHLDEGGSPDHIAILSVAVLYEAGVIGATALLAGFLFLFLALLRASARVGREGLAAACLASLLVIAIAYQATNALHFAVTWLICGAGLAVVAESAASHEPSRGSAPVW